MKKRAVLGFIFATVAGLTACSSESANVEGVTGKDFVSINSDGLNILAEYVINEIPVVEFQSPSNPSESCVLADGSHALATDCFEKKADAQIDSVPQFLNSFWYKPGNSGTNEAVEFVPVTNKAKICTLWKASEALALRCRDRVGGGMTPSFYNTAPTAVPVPNSGG